MIETVIKKAGISINHIWFIPGRDYNTNLAKGSIQFLHGVKEGTEITGNMIRKKEQKTLITDLTKDEPDIWRVISKTYRNEIRRCEKENRKFIFLVGSDILNQLELVEAFEKTYNNMFMAKGIKSRFNRKLFIAYAQNDSLVVSIAYRNDEPVVYHSYIVDGANSRFWYSCSNFREDKEFAEEIGRLNKFLHWNDMVAMKKMGVEVYDWGGIGESQETKGIAEFKRRFGGDELIYHNCICTKNKLLGFVLTLFLK